MAGYFLKVGFVHAELTIKETGQRSTAAGHVGIFDHEYSF
jgi:hypothetical protein